MDGFFAPLTKNCFYNNALKKQTERERERQNESFAALVLTSLCESESIKCFQVTPALNMNDSESSLSSA